MKTALITTTLNSIDFAAMSPLLIVLLGALSLLLLEAISSPDSKKFSFFISLAVISSAFIAAIVAPASDNALLTSWVRFDRVGHLFTLFFLAIAFASVCLAASFFQRFEVTRGEYYFLLLSSLFGLILIGIAADFLTLFLGLETLSIALYVMCGYMKKWSISHEASMKYFLLGALSAAFLLYGIALIYGAIGTTSFKDLLGVYHGLSDSRGKALFHSGIALVTLGLAFKAAIVPFHVWAPDVYDGAPTPVTAFMAVGTKIGAFAAFAIVFLIAVPQFHPLWNKGITLLVYPTLIYANYVALRQTQLRRFFAYSGISHAGFALIALAVGTSEALSSLVFYLAVYSIATLGAFAVLAFLDRRKEGVMLKDLNGLFRESPLLAAAFTICLLTLSGIPPTVGFFAKFYIFKLAFQSGYYALVIVGLLTTILAAFYYLRIVAIMLSEGPADNAVPWRSWPAAFIGIISTAAIILLSFFPAPFMQWLALAAK